MIKEVKAYTGEPEITRNGTLLSNENPKQSDRKRVTKEWNDFSRKNPTATKKLDVCRIVNQELFNAIRSQKIFPN